MTSTSKARVAEAARIVAIVASLSAPAVASFVASAATVYAAPGAAAPSASQEVGMYGDPSAAAPYWRPQHTSDCGEMAVADVVGQITGHEPTEQRITRLAESTPSTARPGPIWKDPANTDIRDLPVLLAHYGIEADNIQTSISALRRDLAERRRVIVILNAETIWNRPGKRDTANHFVVVTGIDPKAGVVHLNDSGIASGRDEQVPITTFAQAWAPNHNSAIVTR
ncbi:MAG: C39 family peptidase [Mycobacterium sp.]|nr:C39 family peptidase [Mycobacterium sp.]MBV9722635.1 C39 family peptidase [Mycobacterium sp.]